MILHFGEIGGNQVVDLIKNKNKIISGIFISLLSIFIIFILSSCNLFFSSPHGRENLDDPAAQITAFTAVPSSDNSIMTMWNWKDPPSWVYDDRITEIQIQHSILGYPDNFVFFAGERFTDNSIWQYEWKDLIPGVTHYFSIFALATNGDEDDIRYAPIKAKAKLPGVYQTGSFGFTSSVVVDDLNTVVGGTAGVPVRSSSAPNSVLVIELDVPDDIYIISATIETFVTSGGITTTNPLRVYPVNNYWDETSVGGNGYSQLTDNFLDDYAVDDSVSAFIDSAEPTLNNVTEVIQKALLYPPKQIVFKTDIVSDSIVTVFNSTFLDIEYISN